MIKQLRREADVLRDKKAPQHLIEELEKLIQQEVISLQESNQQKNSRSQSDLREKVLALRNAQSKREADARRQVATVQRLAEIDQKTFEIEMNKWEEENQRKTAEDMKRLAELQKEREEDRERELRRDQEDAYVAWLKKQKKAWYEKLWDGAKEFCGAIWDGATYVVGKIWNGVKWVGEKTWEGLKWLGDKVWEGLKWMGNWIWEHKWEILLAVVIVVVLIALKASGSEVSWGGVAESIKEGISNFIDWIKSKLSSTTPQSGPSSPEGTSTEPSQINLSETNQEAVKEQEGKHKQEEKEAKEEEERRPRQQEKEGQPTGNIPYGLPTPDDSSPEEKKEQQARKQEGQKQEEEGREPQEEEDREKAEEGAIKQEESQPKEQETKKEVEVKKEEQHVLLEEEQESNKQEDVLVEIEEKIPADETKPLLPQPQQDSTPFFILSERVEQELSNMNKMVLHFLQRYAPSKEEVVVTNYTKQVKDMIDNLSRSGSSSSLDTQASTLVEMMSQLAQDIKLSQQAVGILSNQRALTKELKEQLEIRAKDLQTQLDQLNQTKEQLEKKIKEKPKPSSDIFQVDPKKISETTEKVVEEIIKEDKKKAEEAAKKAGKKFNPQEVPQPARCNIGVRKVFKKLTGSNELDGKLANDMMDHFANSDNWEEIDSERALEEVQERANKGEIVVAGITSIPGEKCGHVAMVVPSTRTDGKGEYSKNWGGDVPMTMDTGEEHRWSYKRLSEGFGANKQKRIKFYRYKGPIQK